MKSWELNVRASSVCVNEPVAPRVLQQALASQNRKTLIPVLFTVYDLISIHPLDMKGFTTTDFLKLIKSDALRRFAVENYFCTENLLVMFSLEGQHIDKINDQYPLARAIVGLVGGVLAVVYWEFRKQSGK